MVQPIHNSSQAQSQGNNSLPERDRDVVELAAVVRSLQEECQSLRQSLAQVEEERNLYLKALYAQARETLPCKVVDIPELEKSSAGPVEIME
jgi:hypothetical protein